MRATTTAQKPRNPPASTREANGSGTHDPVVVPARTRPRTPGAEGRPSTVAPERGAAPAGRGPAHPRSGALLAPSRLPASTGNGRDVVARALARGATELPASVRAHFGRVFADAPPVRGTDDGGARPVGGWLVGRPDSPAEIRASEATRRGTRASADAHAGGMPPRFDAVRVHDDPSAARAARAVGARAFSLGEDIFFAAGHYQPWSSAGRELIGHELAHVLQARASGPVVMRQVFGEVDTGSPEYLRGYNDGRANNVSRPGPLAEQALAEYDAGYAAGSTEATQAQRSLPPVARVSGLHVPASLAPASQAPAVQPPGAPAPAPPSTGLAAQLQIIEETGPATQTRLDAIIRTGGPMPDVRNGAKVVGAAIIDVEGYEGPREMRAINGADTDRLGQGAPVYHATTPTARQLSATQGARTARGGRQASITGPRDESIFPHLNDAEMKMFEDIIRRLPPGARGTISFTTVRVRQVNGQTVIEPYPACSGCIRASFETAGTVQHVVLVSHAPPHPPLSTADSSQFPGFDDEHGGAASGGGEPPATGTAGRTGAISDTESPQVAPGGPGPVPRGGGSAAQGGHAAQVAVHIGTGVASIGLSWLAAYLKARVDARIAQRQIDALLHMAREQINANPDAALRRMMLAPDASVYAWVYLDSAVITTFGVDSTSPEPVTADSAPVIVPSHIEYQSAPVDPSMVDSFPRVSGGGRHYTTVRSIVIDIPLQTPPLQELIADARSRNLPLDDVRAYVSSRYQGAEASYQLMLDTQAGILASYQSTLAAFQQIQGAFRIAQQRHNLELQRSTAQQLLSVARTLESITDLMPSARERIQQASERVSYWQHILDGLAPTHP